MAHRPPVTRTKLLSTPLYQYKSRIKLKDIYPLYFRLLKRFRLLRASNKASNTSSIITKACCDCRFCNSGCTATASTCPSMATSMSAADLQQRLEFERTTIQQILAGVQPFAFINKVRKYKVDPNIYRNDEFRDRDVEVFLTYSSNPYMHIADYKFIINQLNNNVYPDAINIESMDYHIYYYIYKRLIINELVSMGILDAVVNGVGSITAANCVQCEIANSQSPLCSVCQLSTDNGLYTYLNKVISSNDMRFVNNWNNQPDKQLQDLTRGFRNGIIYVWMKPISGSEQELCSTNTNIRDVINYGLYLSPVRKQPVSFMLFGVTNDKHRVLS